MANGKTAARPDVRLVFGADSASYGQINGDLKLIIDRINKNPKKLRLGIDMSFVKSDIAKELTRVSTDIQKLQNGKKKITIKVGKISAAGAIDDFKKQIDGVLKTLSIRSGYNVSMPTDKIEITTDAVKKLGQEAQRAGEKARKAASDASNADVDLIKNTMLVDNKLADVNSKLEKFSAAKYGKSSGSYSQLESASRDLENLKSKLSSGGVEAEKFKKKFDEICSSCKQAEASIKASGEATRSLSDRFKSLGEKFSMWLSTTALIMYVIRGVKSMISSVRDLDDAMTQLKIVTGATDGEMTQFLSKSTKLAKDLGKSISDVMSSIETFSRLGYNLEDSSTLAKYANVLSNVASVDTKTATTGLTSIIKGYGLNVSNAEHVSDVLIKVGQEYAVSAGEMMEAYQKAGAALNSTNTSFEKSAGLIAAANASVQDASTVGTALKTISARIRGSKTDLEELGESTEELADGFSKYSKELNSITGFDIMKEGTTNTFKDIYDIFDGIAKSWDTLSDTQQARVSEILGGTRQLTVVSSILANWEDSVNAYDAAINSAGTSTEANVVWMESINAHAQQLKATFQDLSNNAISTDLINGFIDFGKVVLEVVNVLFKLINCIGGLKTVITATIGIVGIISANKMEVQFKRIKKSIDTLRTSLSSFYSVYSRSFSEVAALGAAPLRAAASGIVSLKDAILASLSPAQLFMLKLMAIIAVITVVAKVVDALTITQKEAAEAARDAVDKAESVSNELNELSETVEKTRNRIYELQTLSNNGTITLVEKEELEKLREANEEYAVLIARKRDEAAMAAKEANDALGVSYDKNLFSSSTESSGGTFLSGGSPKQLDYSGYVDELVKKYKELKEAGVDTSGAFNSLLSVSGNLYENYISEWQGTEEELANDQKYQEIKALYDLINSTIYPASYLLDQINKIVSSDDIASLEKLGGSGDLTEEYVNTMLTKYPDLQDAMDRCGYSAKDLVSNWQQVAEAMGDASSAAASVSSAVSSLSSVSESIKSLDSAYGEFVSEGSIGFSTLASINDAFKDTIPNIDEYILRLSKTGITSGDVRDTLSDLAKQFVVGKVSVGELTAADESLVSSMLSQVGIANSAEVAHDLLNQAMLDEIVTSYDLVNAKSDEIEAILSEASASGYTAEQIALYTIKKKLANGTAINTSGDIKSLMSLAKACGVVDSALVQTARAKALYEHLENGKIAGMSNTDWEQYSSGLRKQLDGMDIAGEINKAISNIGTGVNVNWSGSSYSDKSGSSSNEKTWFDKMYEKHNHMLSLDKEITSDYLRWLDGAYKQAYDQRIIGLEDYYKYEQEVYEGLKDLFKDGLSDSEHEISMMSNFSQDVRRTVEAYTKLINSVEDEISDARSRGLDDNDAYIQELQDRWFEYSNAIKDIRENATSEAKDSIKDLVDIRVDMLKKDVEDQKDAIKEKLDYLKDFYDKQKDMLDETNDDRNYKDNQDKYRKSVSDLQAEMSQLDYDNSAWAQKRKIELAEELSSAQKELNDFERDHALEVAKDELTKLYDAQEKALNDQEDLLDKKLDDAKALYEQALSDIKSGSISLYEEMIEYNNKYGSGIETEISDKWELAYSSLQKYYTLYGEMYNGFNIANATGYVNNDGSWNSSSISGSNQANVSGNRVYNDPHDNGYDDKSSSSSSSIKASETSGNIGLGASGDSVKAIQSALVALGYSVGSSGVDGKYGNNTYAAVKKLQKDNKISSDGVVGNNTRAVFKALGYSYGTGSATPGIHRFGELGDEYVFQSSNGSKYRLFDSGDKVLNAKSTNFLYNFATSGGSILFDAVKGTIKSITSKIGESRQIGQISMGNIIVQGNANDATVSEIRRAQRDSVDYMLKQLNKLGK